MQITDLSLMHALDAEPVLCSLEMAVRISKLIERAGTRADEGPEMLTFGRFPPTPVPGHSSQALRFYRGERLTAALLVVSEPVERCDAGGPAAWISLAFTAEKFREAARAVLGAEGNDLPEGRIERLRAIVAEPDLEDSSPSIVAQALLAFCEWVDQDRNAVREQERASTEIRAKLEQSERSRAHAVLARALGHTFHNRLAVIQARADLTAVLHDDVTTRMCANEIADACRSCCDILVRMQSYASRRPLSVGGQYRLDDAAEQALAGLEPFLEACNAVQPGTYTVRRQLNCDLPIQVPREDLQAAVEALVTNAVEAMPEGGDVVVRTWDEEGWAVFEVEDNGIGMSEAVANRVFNPFYTTKGGGRTGLSLGQVQALVVEHGGSIEVDTAEGEGSRFRVRLPGPTREAGGAHTVSRTALPGAVLVIEDENDVRNALIELLEAMGYEVIGASGGHMAERVIEDREVGLVLTDLGVPDLTAFSLAKRIRARGVEAPIVLLTGWGHEVAPAAAREAGIDIVLTKPIAAADLSAALGALGMNKRADPI